MFGKIQRSSSRAGLVPVKVHFKVHVVSIMLPSDSSSMPADGALLTLCLERGGRVASSTELVFARPMFEQDVLFSVGQWVDMTSTLYRDPHSGAWQVKTGRILLRERCKGKLFSSNTVLGGCDLPMHEFAADMGFELTLTKSCTYTLRDIGALLVAEVCATVVREVQSGASSVASAGSDVSDTEPAQAQVPTHTQAPTQAQAQADARAEGFSNFEDGWEDSYLEAWPTDSAINAADNGAEAQIQTQAPPQAKAEPEADPPARPLPVASPPKPQKSQHLPLQLQLDTAKATAEKPETQPQQTRQQQLHQAQQQAQEQQQQVQQQAQKQQQQVQQQAQEQQQQ
ncbi:hypothetical protein B484DRAFT_397821, partial [Ochromonadaceae sp. CCMP2298]